MENLMYKSYEEMIQGYKEKQDGLFEHGVRSWMSFNSENPFVSDTKESECFFRIKMAYQRWAMNGVDKNINRIRMLNAAKELCQLSPVNPYKAEEKKPEKKKFKREPAEEIHDEPTEIAQKEEKNEESHAAKVFGVVDKGWFVKDKESQEIKASRLKSLFKNKD